MDLQTSHLAAALMSGAAYNANSDTAPISEETEKPPEVQKDPSDEDKEDASGEEFTDEESEAQTGSKSMPGRGVTLPMLLDDKMLEPGIAAMTIEYLGQKFVGDLQTDGKIKSHETETIFCSPSAWAIHCKRIINPDKRSGCGWASVKYRGKKLDTIKATYLRKKQLQRENMHSDEETEMEVESPPEPPPQRVVMKHNTVPNRMMQHDANMLIESISFTSAGKVQPFMVSVSSNASLVLDIHCHLKKEEVYGYLAGTWDLNNHNVMITHTFPCLVSKTDKKPRVMVEIEIQMEIEKLGLVLLGWYHSHPTNPAMPSLRDCDNQLEYQIKMRGPTEVSYVPCVGVICSPYNPESPELESSLTFFWVMPPPEQRPTEYPRPLYLQHNIVHDTHLSPHAMEQIRKTIKYYFSFPDDTFINFKDSYKPDISYLDKLKCTLTGKFPREQSDGLLWHFIREELGCSSENDDKMDLDALLAVPQPIPVSKPTPSAPVPTFPSVSTLQQMVSRPAGVPPISASSSIGSGSPHKFETPQLNIPVLPSSSKSSSKSTTPTLPPSYPTGLDMLTSMALGLGSANMSMPLGASSLESLAAANSMLNSLAPGLTASLTGGKLPDPPSYAASLQNLTNSLSSFDKTSSNTSTTSSTPIPANIASNLMMSSADIANALFSATKYSNAGILGIPDPMSKSTLAANNMFLSPSLIKMQESLMKPLSTSSPISSKAGLDQSALMKSPHELMKTNKDYGKDYSKDYVKDMKKEYSKEHCKDFSKDYSKDYGKDFSREQSKNYRKDYGKDFSREQSKDYGIDYSREQCKDYSKSYEKDFSREQSKDFGKILGREQSKDYIKDLSMDQSKAYSKDYGKDLSMDQSKAYIKDFGKDLSMDQSKAYSKDYGKDLSMDQSKAYSKDFGKDLSMDQSKAYSKDYGKDLSMDQSKAYSKDYGKDLSMEQSKAYSKDYGKDLSMEQSKAYSKDYGKDLSMEQSKAYSKDYGKDLSMEQSKAYSKDYGKDLSMEQSKAYSKDLTMDHSNYGKDYGKDLSMEQSKPYSKDYGKDITMEQSKDYGKGYGKDFSMEQSKDFGKDFNIEPSKNYSKDFSMEQSKEYSKDYGKDYSKEYGKDFRKDYGNDTSKDYTKESSRDFSKDYTKDIIKDYNKDYVADYSKNYNKDYGKDFGKDYTKESKEHNKDYGKDYTKEYGKDYLKDYGKDYTKEYANRDYNKEFKDYAKEYKDYLPPDFGSVAKGKPDIPVAEPMQVSDHCIAAKSDVSKPEPMDTQATDFSIPPRVGGESFLNQMLELTKKTTMADYMGDYNPPSKISKIEELAPLASMPPTIHPYLDSADIVDSLPPVMSAIGTYVKPDQPLDCGKEQDFSPQPKPSESDK